MDMSIEERNGIHIITVNEPRMDAKAAGPFKERLLALIDEGNNMLLLNLAKVTFIDSSGIGAVISGLRKVGLYGDIKLCELTPQVDTMLKLTRLDKVIDHFNTQEEAITRFTTAR